MDTKTPDLGRFTPERAARFAAGLAPIASKLDAGSARSYRSYASRYLEICRAADLDPLAPGRDRLKAALGSAGITGQARWKAMWVARTTVNASVPAASGRAGLGMGRSDATFRANFVRDTLNDDWER